MTLAERDTLGAEAYARLLVLFDRRLEFMVSWQEWGLSEPRMQARRERGARSLKLRDADPPECHDTMNSSRPDREPRRTSIASVSGEKNTV